MSPTRKETPDLLGEILGAKVDVEPAPEEQPAAAVGPAVITSKPVKRQTSKSARRGPDKSAQVTDLPTASEPEPEPESEPGPTPTEIKVKATYYLSPSIMDALEGGQLQLRRLAPREKRLQVSKSLIVEQALLIALDELEDQGAGSRLAERLSQQHVGVSS